MGSGPMILHLFSWKLRKLFRLIPSQTTTEFGRSEQWQPWWEARWNWLKKKASEVFSERSEKKDTCQSRLFFVKTYFSCSFCFCCLFYEDLKFSILRLIILICTYFNFFKNVFFCLNKSILFRFVSYFFGARVRNVKMFRFNVLRELC